MKTPRWLLLIVGLAAMPAATHAQTVSAGLYGTSMRSRSSTPGTSSSFDGFVFGGFGNLRYDYLVFELSYGQGDLETDDDVTREYVEGTLMVGVAPLPHLEILTGPRIRAFSGPGRVAASVTERWLLWEALARYDVGIYEDAYLGTDLRVFAEGRVGFAGNIDAPQPFDSGRGGQVGALLRIRDPAIDVRFFYAIDETRLRDAARRETVESVGVAVSFVLFQW